MSTPSFVNIFIMKRILKMNPKAKDLDVSSHKEPKIASAILTLLSSKEIDISYFLTNAYRQEDDNIFSFLFDKMITNFPNEYKTVISFENNCVSNNNNNKINSINNNNNNNILAPRYYERLLFNQRDLIPKIFQYVSWINVNSCCLVNSIWLYHGYNIHSIYSFDSRMWFRDQDVEDGSNFNPYLKQKIRFLQRLIKIQKFHYTYQVNNWDINKSLLNKFVDTFKKFQHIQFIDICLGADTDNRNDVKFEQDILHLISKNSTKLKCFRSNCSHTIYDPSYFIKMDLSNCYEIEICTLFPIIFTNKCEKLTLNSIIMKKYWWDNIFDNCDFSNIKHLLLKDIAFRAIMFRYEQREILSKLVSKLCNLKILSIEKPSYHMYFIWKALIPTIKRNNTLVELLITVDTQVDDRVIEFLEKNQCTLNVLTSQEQSDAVSKFILKLLFIKSIQKTIEKIAFYNCGELGIMHVLRAINKDWSVFYHHRESQFGHNCEQLKVLYIDGAGNKSDFYLVNDLLRDTQHGYFVWLDNIVIFYYDTTVGFRDTFSSQFAKLVSMIVNMIENEIPMNINIDFKINFKSKNDKTKQQDDIMTIFQDLYQIVFIPPISLASNNDIDYQKSAKCNKYYQWLSVAKFDFEVHDLINVHQDGWKDDDEFRYHDSKFDVATLRIQTAQSIESNVHLNNA